MSASLDVQAWLPQVAELTMEHDPACGWRWSAADSDGNPVDLDVLHRDNGDAQLPVRSALTEAGHLVDPDKPDTLEPRCDGYLNTSNARPAGLEVDPFTGRVVRAHLDVAFITRRW